jgi:DNA-directed RNA polymerase specialized sigma24 family protein
MATPTPAPTTTGSQRPFDALDAEWTVLCRRHRRSTLVADWAHQQPALAGVTRLAEAIPPTGVDRRPHCQALAALAATGDDLAARALLQLLVPGLVRLAARWRWQLDGMDAAGWEVIARAGLHIGRLTDTRISGSVAGWLLRSVERDLVDDTRRTRRFADGLAIDDPSAERAMLSTRHPAPSAEDEALAGPLVWSALADATHRGALSNETARVVVLHAAGHSLPELARRTGTSRATVYRLRDRGHAQLRDGLAVAS